MCLCKTQTHTHTYDRLEADNCGRMRPTSLTSPTHVLSFFVVSFNWLLSKCMCWFRLYGFLCEFFSSFCFLYIFGYTSVNAFNGNYELKLNFNYQYQHDTAWDQFTLSKQCERAGGGWKKSHARHLRRCHWHKTNTHTHCAQDTIHTGLQTFTVLLLLDATCRAVCCHRQCTSERRTARTHRAPEPEQRPFSAPSLSVLYIGTLISRKFDTNSSKGPDSVRVRVRSADLKTITRFFGDYDLSENDTDCSQTTEGVFVVGGDRGGTGGNCAAAGCWCGVCGRQEYYATAEQSGDCEQTDHVRAGEESLWSAGPSAKRCAHENPALYIFWW